jgi:hypothetical protein
MERDYTAWAYSEIEKLKATNKKLMDALQECITTEGALCFGDMGAHPEWMQRRLYAITDIACAVLAEVTGVQ